MNDERTIMSDTESNYRPEDDVIEGTGVYGYDFQWYHSSFPREWVFNTKEYTGPSQCGNCEAFGCVNGVCIGYCANCAVYVYEGKRGRGFIDVGVELDNQEGVTNFPSAFETYLSGVNLADIKNPDPNYGSYEHPPMDMDIDEIDRMIDERQRDEMEISDEEQEDIDSQEFDDEQLHDSAVSVFSPNFEGGYNDW